MSQKKESVKDPILEKWKSELFDIQTSLAGVESQIKKTRNELKNTELGKELEAHLQARKTLKAKQILKKERLNGLMEYQRELELLNEEREREGVTVLKHTFPQESHARPEPVKANGGRL